MNQGKKEAVLRALKLLGDQAVLHLSIILAFLLRYGGFPAENFVAYQALVPWIALGGYLVFQTYGLYADGRRAWAETAYSILCAIFVSLFGTMALSYFFRAFSFPRLTLFITAGIQLPLFLAWRYWLWGQERRALGTERVMVVGSFDEAQKVAAKLEDGSGGHLKVAGLAVPFAVPGPLSAAGRYPLLAWPGEGFDRLLAEVNPDAVFLAPSLAAGDKAVVTAACLAQDRRVYLVPDLYEILLAQARLEQVDDTPVFALGNISLSDSSRLAKRIMDVAISALLLVLALPVMLLVALAVKLDSRGPVFYCQERVGENGRSFPLYKFRTMVQEAEAATGPVLATRDDPRVTRVGRFLRLTRLDELPQFINVLKGDMSLVGPRPERPFFVEKFSLAIPGYAYRLRLKSGLTGLAQVAGKYDTSPQDKLRYDLFYAKAYSPLLDLRIIFQTLKVLLMRDRAS